MKTCKIEGCNLKHYAKGFCKYHYQTQWRIGKPEPDKKPFLGNDEDRLKFYSVKKDNGCIEWTGGKDKDGYGQIRGRRPHRVSYELAYGEIPEGFMVLHSCNNPACINPEHLRVGTHLDNMADRMKNEQYKTNEEHPMVKYSNAIVEEIRKASGTLKGLSEIYGMSASQIGNIKRGTQRKLFQTGCEEYRNAR